MVSSGRVAALLGLLFGLAGSSTSAVTVALPEMAADLDVSASTAAWAISGYTVALAVATATTGASATCSASGCRCVSALPRWASAR